MAVLLCILLPATARAVQLVNLSASLTPEHLGRGSTVGFGFQIESPSAQAPSPLTELELRYPRTLGLAVSGLGVATCLPATLEAAGPHGCPVDSFMGFGSAMAEVPFGPTTVREKTAITIIRAPTEAGHLALLMHAAGSNPVIAQLILPTFLLPSSSSLGESLQTKVPLIPSLPGAPDVSIVSLQARLGPQGLIYNERVGAKTVYYRPSGILLPDSCPRGGFRFSASFSFLDGSHANGHATVACPGARSKR